MQELAEVEKHTEIFYFPQIYAFLFFLFYFYYYFLFIVIIYKICHFNHSEVYNSVALLQYTIYNHLFPKLFHHPNWKLYSLSNNSPFLLPQPLVASTLLPACEFANSIQGEAKAGLQYSWVIC